MTHEKILEDLGEAVRNSDDDRSTNLAERAIKIGIDPSVALEEGLAKALREVGDSFGRGEAFITELIATAQAVEAGTEILNREITKRSSGWKAVAGFLIGTMEGDIHSIGKNIVVTMLRATGFEVIDLGVEVPTDVFVGKVREMKPDILGLSALMTTTMTRQRDVIEALEEAGLRGDVRVIVGGASVTEEWVEETGADACGMDSGNAVDVALSLMGEG